MRARRAAASLAAGWLLVFASFAFADEIVETTDGRRLRLRSDGIYEFLSRLDPAVMERAVAAAKQWAQDQTLILYCFRDQPNGQMLANAVVQDRDEALARLRHGGATEQQLRQVAVVIAENFRQAAPGSDDKAMTAACSVRDVERHVYLMNEIAWPLQMRPPFRDWK